MSLPLRFEGVMPANLLPFRADLSIDEAAYRAHLRWLAGVRGVTGLVVNDRPPAPRDEVDLLRAILPNCRRHGPSSQNRDGVPAFEQHLRGRIAWVAQHDPVRGARLLAEHEAVDWSR